MHFTLCNALIPLRILEVFWFRLFCPDHKLDKLVFYKFPFYTQNFATLFSHQINTLYYDMWYVKNMSTIICCRRQIFNESYAILPKNNFISKFILKIWLPISFWKSPPFWCPTLLFFQVTPLLKGGNTLCIETKIRTIFYTKPKNLCVIQVQPYVKSLSKTVNRS